MEVWWLGVWAKQTNQTTNPQLMILVSHFLLWKWPERFIVLQSKKTNLRFLSTKSRLDFSQLGIGNLQFCGSICSCMWGEKHFKKVAVPKLFMTQCKNHAAHDLNLLHYFNDTTTINTVKTHLCITFLCIERGFSALSIMVYVAHLSDSNWSLTLLTW